MSEFGWLYVHGNKVGQGPSGSLQRAENQNLTGSSNLTYNEAAGALDLTGSLNVSGAINANSLNINVTNKNVINLSATGSTKFGDSVDDTHVFTGSINLSSSTNPLKIYGLQSGSGIAGNSILALDSSNNIILTSSTGGGGGIIDEYTNPGNNRIITSIDSSGINAEVNLSFDGNLLSITGAVSSSVGISSSVGQYTHLTGSYIQGTNITATTVNATSLGGALTTAAQGAVTSLGTLTALNVSGDLSASSLFVSSSNERVGIGTSSPEKKLEIYDKNDQLRLTYSKYIPFLESNVHTDLNTNSNGYLIISSSGQRVGIGTETPTRMLDVNGNMRVGGNLEITGTLSAKVTDFVVSANNITFGDSATDTLTFNAATASIPNNLNIASNLLFLDNGNSKVGIGVATPDSKLEILSTAEQFKISYNQSHSTKLVVNSSGNFNITPTGNAVSASADLFVSGSTVLGSDSTKSTVITGPLTASVAISSSLGQFHALTASQGLITSFTDGTATITGGNINSVGTLTATNVGGTLSTAAQPNVTSLGTLTGLSISGDLTVDTDTLKVDSSNDRVGIGRNDPQKTLEVLDTGKQLRLSYSKFVFGVSANVFSDVSTDSNGLLILSGSGGKTKIDNNLQITGLLGGTGVTTKYLALDSSNNVILTSSVTPGIETRTRRVITGDSTLTSGDYYVGVSASSNVVLTLLDASTIPNGQTFTIKDERGNANSIEIKIKTSGSQLIDGEGFAIIESPFGAINIYVDGASKYFIF